jgi:hypothetical protein
MSAVRNWLAKLAALALCATAGAVPALTPLSHSTLVTIDAALDAGTLILRVRRTGTQAPVPVTQLQVTLDGRNLPVTPRADGTWGAVLGRRPAGSPDGTLAITLTHDGVREILTGRLPGTAAAGAAGSAASLLRSHKQLAWWVLNIAVVLIGVIAVSRRMST